MGHNVAEDHILRMFRFAVTESGVATYTEAEINTNLDLDSSVVGMIHLFEVELPPSLLLDLAAAGGNEKFALQVCKQSQTGETNINNPDLILKAHMQMERWAAVGTDAGPMYQFSINPVQWHYDPPIIFASQILYVGVVSTAGTARVVRGRIGYTLAKMPEKTFLRLATSLLE